MWTCSRCQHVNEPRVQICANCGQPAGDGWSTALEKAGFVPRDPPAIPRESRAVVVRSRREPAWVGALRERAGYAGRWILMDARIWATGRPWIWRAIILIYIAYAGYRHLTDPLATDITGWLTVGVHELGHFVTAWAPKFVCVAAGSIFQVLAPLYLIWEFKRQRDYFAVAVAGFWLASSLFAMAAYMGDAQSQSLDMISLAHTNDLENDWHYMLSAWGILDWCTALSWCVRVLAGGVLIGSFAWGAWLCSIMFVTRRQPQY